MRFMGIFPWGDFEGLYLRDCQELKMVSYVD